MSRQYSDYQKMSVPVKELVFDKVQESDKELIRKVKSEHIKANRGLLVLLAIAFIACAWFFIQFLIVPPDIIIFEIMSLLILGAVMVYTGSLIFGIIGGVKGIRKGIVLTASRQQEVKDERNSTYQYVVDIYFDDRDETLMSYSISKDVFGAVRPGDGVVVVKIGRKILVLADPERKEVMDVSTIRSKQY